MSNREIRLFIIRQSIIMCVLIYGQITSALCGWWLLAMIFCFFALCNLHYTYKKIKEIEKGRNNGSD